MRKLCTTHNRNSLERGDEILTFVLVIFIEQSNHCYCLLKINLWISFSDMKRTQYSIINTYIVLKTKYVHSVAAPDYFV